MIMKRILTFVLTVAASVAILNADDRPVTVDRLPAAARAFITENYPDDKISYATVDDDFILPDYRVVLANGVKIQFDNSGALEKIESLNGVPEVLVPVQIKDYLSAYYPDVKVVEYVKRFVRHAILPWKIKDLSGIIIVMAVMLALRIVR